MRKTLWKCLAVVPLLGMTLWWIHSESQEAGLSAAPLAAYGSAGGSSHGEGGLGFGPGIDPRVGFDSLSFGDPGWRRAALWDDGKAEFCAYEVSWAHYGHLYKGRALLVLVKEPWNAALDVKADNPARRGFEVLKLNQVRDVATGIYTYHQMASVFWRRDTGALQKIAATSSEACGISSAEMTRGRLQTHSYFDGQGDRALAYPEGAVPEDGLPAALRDFVTGSAPAFLAVFPSLLAARLPDLAPRIYSLDRRDAAQETVEVRLSSGPSKLTYAFERRPPHHLLRFEREDGTVYKLAKCERLAYWQMHDPGAEAWLPGSVR